MNNILALVSAVILPLLRSAEAFFNAHRDEDYAAGRLAADEAVAIAKRSGVRVDRVSNTGEYFALHAGGVSWQGQDGQWVTLPWWQADGLRAGIVAEAEHQRVMAMPPTAFITPAVKDLLKGGNKIQAIKAVRLAMPGADLRTAKGIIDAYCASQAD